jgi:hypothetical protein
VLSLLSLVGVGGDAAGVPGWLPPVLIVLTVLLLGRAFYILYVKRRGTRLSAAITWLSALLVIAYWGWRLLAWLGVRETAQWIG